MLRLGVFGGLSVEVDGVAVALPDRRSARSLLAWLALNPGFHARSRTAALFWPDVTEEAARMSLRAALASIRRSLGASARGALVATREEVGLATGAEVWVDAREFRRLLTA